MDKKEGEGFVYSCNLNIVIISRSHELEGALSGLPAPERFSFALETLPGPVPDALGRADLLILDGLPGERLAALRAGCKKACRIVLCASAEQISAMRQAELSLLDAVWPAPLSGEAAAFCFQKLIDSVKLQKDYRLIQSWLDTAIDSIPDLVWFKDLKGAHLKVNSGFCQAVGKTREQCEGRGHYYIWDLKQEEYDKGEYVCLETEEEVIRRRETCLFDEKVKSKQGMRQFKTYKSPIFDEEGALIGTVGIAHDVTDLQNIGAELELILRNMPFAILLTNEEGRIINLNQKFCESFGVSAQELCGIDYEEWKGRMHQLPDGEGEGASEVLLQFPGRNIFLALREEPILDIFGNFVGRLCIFRDVTVERSLRQQIIHSANTDFMTGLYNRRYLYEFIRGHSGQEQVSLLYVDLDNFKQVNDTYGHQTGDHTIIAVADALKRHFCDCCVARIGGDEFLVVLLGTRSEQEVTRHAQELIDDLDGLFATRPEWQGVSASVGVSMALDGDGSIDDLIRRSDIALYEAKQVGKSQWRLFVPPTGNGTP